MTASTIFSKMYSYINFSLIPLKAHYFVMYGAVAGVSPFLTVIGKDLGLNATAVGIAYTVLPAFVFFFRPLFGFISDYFQNIKTIIISLLTVTVILYLFIPFIKPIQDDVNFKIETQLICSEQSHHQILSFNSNEPCMKNVSSLSGIKCNISFADYFTENSTQKLKRIVEMEAKYQCKNDDRYKYKKSDDTTVNSADTSCSLVLEGNRSELKILCENHSSLVPSSFQCDSEFEMCLKSSYDGKFYNTSQFWFFTFLVGLGLGFMSTVSSLTDTACYEVLGEKRDCFGQQRLWGTASTGIITLFAGYLNDITAKDKEKSEYLSGFYIMIVLYIINMIILFKMNLPKVHLSKNITSDIVSVCKSKEFLVYGVAVFVIGNFASLNANFLFWYLKDLGADQTLLGSAIAVQCLAELPFFFFSGWIIKYLGYFNSLTWTFVSFALRFGCYALIENPWLVIPIEVLHGITYAVFYASKTSFVSVYATPGTEATVLGILGAIYEGIGFALGSMCGGLGFHHFGGSETFLFASIFSIVCIPFTVLSHFFFKK